MSSTISRRQLLTTIAIGTAAARMPVFATARSLKGTAINHISYQSADYKKTRDFYVDLLGFQSSDEDDKQLYLWAGDSLISAKNSPPTTSPRMDHCGFTVEPWDVTGVQAALEERGLPATLSKNDPHDPDRKSVFTRDPNRYNLQLCAKDLETKPAPAVSRAPLRAVAVNHVSYLCADYRKARDFYAELMDLRTSNDDGSLAYLWFGDAFVAVRNSRTGNPGPLIDYVAWTLADWNQNRVVAEFKGRGFDARPDASGKSVLSKDLNGYPLMLCSSDFQRKPQA